jgi:hypothetical protein
VAIFVYIDILQLNERSSEVRQIALKHPYIYIYIYIYIYVIYVCVCVCVCWWWLFNSRLKMHDGMYSMRQLAVKTCLQGYSSPPIGSVDKCVVAHICVNCCFHS